MNNVLVEVAWHDICSFGTGSWNKPDFVEKCQSPICKSVGYIVKENNDYLWLTETINDILGIGVVKVIPKGCIKYINDLTQRPKRRTR